MTIQDIMESLEHEAVLVITEEELDALLAEAKLLRQRDTTMNGLIRVLEYHDAFIIQEYSDKKEVILRTTDSLEAAGRFIEKRLEVYEKMWDGCGCRIDYHK